MASERKRRSHVILPLVTPHQERLPLDDSVFPVNCFKAFCRDLFSQLRNVRTCHHYRRWGDEQEDIVQVNRYVMRSCMVRKECLNVRSF
jgi:hypothetical protein